MRYRISFFIKNYSTTLENSWNNLNTSVRTVWETITPRSFLLAWIELYFFQKNTKSINTRSKNNSRTFAYFNMYSFTARYVYNITTIVLCSILFKFMLILNYLTQLYNALAASFRTVYKTTSTEGYIAIRGLLIIILIDAGVTDDEPLWEPIEWSLVQTWILFSFIFGWIAENLITSRYGSFTGKDKRVWFAWYKMAWIVDLFYIVSYAITSFLVITPFYNELTYNLTFVVSWWDWYSRLFFFKFICVYTIVLIAAQYLLIKIKSWNWKKSLVVVIFVNLFLTYLLFTHFIMAFFSYFTDPLWYSKVRYVDYIQASHEPSRWGWGARKKDHFTYHSVRTVFWYKNDSPFSGSFLLIHFYFFINLIMVYLYWLTLLRRLISTAELTYTFTTFCVSALRQFFYFFFLMYGFVFASYLLAYWRFPFELSWNLNSNYWLHHFVELVFEFLTFF